LQLVVARLALLAYLFAVAFVTGGPTAASAPPPIDVAIAADDSAAADDGDTLAVDVDADDDLDDAIADGDFRRVG
jgi:hypothetical protein